MAEATTASHNIDSIHYHRRIDRTPEKDFDKRPEEDKKRTAMFRASVEGAIKKVTALKDKLEESPEKAAKSTESKETQASLSFMSISSPLTGYYGHAFGTHPFAQYVGSPYSALLNSTSASSVSSPPQCNANPGMLNSSHPFLTSVHNSFSQTSPTQTSLSTSTAGTSPQKGLSDTSHEKLGTNLEPSASGAAFTDSGLGASSTRFSSVLSPLRPLGLVPYTLPYINPFMPDPMLSWATRFPPETSGNMDQSRQMGVPEQSRQIGILLSEIDTQKVENKKLSEKLAGSERELETLRLMMKTKELEVQSQGSVPAKAAGMGFLDMNLDESMEDEELDREGIEQMLMHIDSPAASDADCINLVQHIEAIKQHRQEVTNEEMHVIMEQRDAALAKAKLATLQQERDMAIAKCRQLEDKIQALCIYYSLHKSLPTENSQREQARNTGQAYESQLKPSSSLEVEMAQKENNRLVAALRTAVIEKKQLEENLKTVQTALNDNKEEKEKLQHLVSVLRRKLNELNNHAEKEWE
ncbi:hypothetical protein ACJMK2_036890 [Sinanodonta woodiana]|uniref:Mirror-image polydactyly 1 n=1 Tax=Sinanodonta woodiana TaxID=1069815 RepID=A0ABD3WMR9_SINWO